MALTLTVACSQTTQTKEKETSLAYKYFKQINYNPQKYTLKLKTKDQEITISKNKDKTYYKNQNQKIIEKNGQRYIIEKDTYTKEPIINLTNYTKGYLPENINNLKKQKYKTGTERKGLLKYKTETYTYSEGKITYYFRKNKLTHIRNKTIQNDITITVISLTNKIDKKEYNLPKEKETITY